MSIPPSFNEDYEVTLSDGRVWKSKCKVLSPIAHPDSRWLVDRWDSDIEDSEETVAVLDEARNVFVGLA